MTRVGLEPANLRISAGSLSTELSSPMLALSLYTNFFVRDVSPSPANLSLFNSKFMKLIIDILFIIKKKIWKYKPQLRTMVEHRFNRPYLLWILGQLKFAAKKNKLIVNYIIATLLSIKETYCKPLPKTENMREKKARIVSFRD